jgi:putative IMPACT (imprinted ancient) family translation regulator
VLRGEEMINVAVLIVRYFGGIKLGIGGLVRAYGNAVKEVISESNNIVLYEKMLKYFFVTSYSQVQRTEYLLKKIDIVMVEREFLGDGVEWRIEATEEKLEKLKEEM